MENLKIHYRIDTWEQYCPPYQDGAGRETRAEGAYLNNLVLNEEDGQDGMNLRTVAEVGLLSILADKIWELRKRCLKDK